MNKLMGLLLLLIFSPIFLICVFLLFIFQGRPIFFIQTRIGKNKKKFRIFKFRTMIVNAESLKENLNIMNEADGPVFKIDNDPRFTKIGKIFSKTALDELPQLVNVLLGDMNIVGPRPLPVSEAELIQDKYNERSTVKPGIVSEWILFDDRHSDFDRWMTSDIDLVNNKSFIDKIIIVFKVLRKLVLNFVKVLIKGTESREYDVNEK